MRAFLFLITVFLLVSCANVLAPTGGPKDLDPPELITTIPKQGQTNYNGSRIMLEFNEFLKLKNPKDEIIITPDIKEVNYSVKKNIVTVELGEKLQENTTYSFSFRESIQDLNEGNPAEDLHLAFSTGDEIDSLEISGEVIELLKGQAADKYTIAIYQSDTFNIFKHRPAYFTRSNKEGQFKILNLKAGDYSMYSFEDKNKNLILDSKTEKSGFVKEKISLLSHQDSIIIKTIPLDARPITVSGIRSLGHFTKLRLNKNLTTYSLVSLDENDHDIGNCFSSTQAEIDIFPNKPVNDSTLIRFIGTDSLEQKLDTTFFVKQTSSKSLKEKIKVTVARCQFTDDSDKFYAELQATELLKAILADSISILVDSTLIAFHDEDIKYDTIFRKIIIAKTFDRKDSIKWKRAKFTLGRMAFTSIYGDSSKTVSTSINVIIPDESATLIIESTVAHSNTLIEILDERQQSLGIYAHTKTLTIPNIKPGTIQLRRISDTNGNGKWDPGNPNLKIPPEDIIFYINNEGKSQIPLRANWEMPIEWNF